MLLNIELTKQDLKALHRCFRSQNKIWTNSYFFIRIIGISFIALGVYLCIANKPYWVFFVLFTGIIYFINPYLQERQVLKQECPKLTLNLDENIVELRNIDKGSYEGHPWRNLDGWLETKNHFFYLFPKIKL
jgi:hypothetical protein